MRKRDASTRLHLVRRRKELTVANSSTKKGGEGGEKNESDQEENTEGCFQNIALHF